MFRVFCASVLALFVLSQNVFGQRNEVDRQLQTERSFSELQAQPLKLLLRHGAEIEHGFMGEAAVGLDLANSYRVITRMYEVDYLIKEYVVLFQKPALDEDGNILRDERGDIIWDDEIHSEIEEEVIELGRSHTETYEAVFEVQVEGSRLLPGESEKFSVWLGYNRQRDSFWPETRIKAARNIYGRPFIEEVTEDRKNRDLNPNYIGKFRITFTAQGRQTQRLDLAEIELLFSQQGSDLVFEVEDKWMSHASRDISNLCPNTALEIEFELKRKASGWKSWMKNPMIQSGTVRVEEASGQLRLPEDGIWVWKEEELRDSKTYYIRYRLRRINCDLIEDEFSEWIRHHEEVKYSAEN